mmetsp:Transcript_25611/g.81284  ORF Transcript_25611/g.81284 Transcript_25611/m.81284 type:complete len:999 (+) Transcript_25611:414-3410(+)
MARGPLQGGVSSPLAVANADKPSGCNSKSKSKRMAGKAAPRPRGGLKWRVVPPFFSFIACLATSIKWTTLPLDERMAKGAVPGALVGVAVNGFLSALCALKRACPDPWERRLAWLRGWEEIDMVAPVSALHLTLTMTQDEARASSLAWNAMERTPLQKLFMTHGVFQGLVLCLQCSAIPFSQGLVGKLLVNYLAIVYLTTSNYPSAFLQVTWVQLAAIFLFNVVAPLVVAARNGLLANGRAADTGQVESPKKDAGARAVPSAPPFKSLQDEMAWLTEEARLIRTQPYDVYRARTVSAPPAPATWESISIKYEDRHMGDFTEEELATYTRSLHAQFPGPQTIVTLSDGCVRADLHSCPPSPRRGTGTEREVDAELAGNATAAFFPRVAGATGPDGVVVAVGGNVFRASDDGSLVWQGELPPRPVVERVFPKVVAGGEGGVITCTCSGVYEGDVAALLYEAAPFDVRLASSAELHPAGSVAEARLALPAAAPRVARMWVRVVSAHSLRRFGVELTSPPLEALMVSCAAAAAEIDSLTEVAPGLAEDLGRMMTVAEVTDPLAVEAAASAMRFLCARGCAAAVEFALPYAARINATGAFCMLVALHNGNHQIVEALARDESSVDLSEAVYHGGSTALHWAASVGDGQALAALLRGGGLRASEVAMQALDQGGYSPLDLAAAAGHWNNVEMIHAAAAGSKPAAPPAGGSTSAAPQAPAAPAAAEPPISSSWWPRIPPAIWLAANLIQIHRLLLVKWGSATLSPPGTSVDLYLAGSAVQLTLAFACLAKKLSPSRVAPYVACLRGWECLNTMPIILVAVSFLTGWRFSTLDSILKAMGTSNPESFSAHRHSGLAIGVIQALLASSKAEGASREYAAQITTVMLFNMYINAYIYPVEPGGMTWFVTVLANVTWNMALPLLVACAPRPSRPPHHQGPRDYGAMFRQALPLRTGQGPVSLGEFRWDRSRSSGPGQISTGRGPSRAGFASTMSFLSCPQRPWSGRGER